MKSFSKFLTTLLFLAAGILLLAGLLPGEFSPAAALKSAADSFVSDGDFETITPSFYNRMRPAMLAAGTALLAFSLLLRQASRTNDPRLSRRVWAVAAAAGAVALLVGGSLAAGGLNSPVYRVMLGTPVAAAVRTLTPTPTVPVTPTPTQTPTPTPPPVTTPLQPGSLELVIKLAHQPTVLVSAHDGTGRLFIGTRAGLVLVLKDGAILPEPFLDLSDRMPEEFANIEQGLVGLVFHPDYLENGYFYVDYIDRDHNIAVSRFEVSGTDPNRADPDSEYRLFGVVKTTSIHHGGQMAFGPDGYLYIAVGDGGIQMDPFGFAQSTDTLNGKILRIDVDGPGQPYDIPADNPFADSAGMDEIYYFGLRNPWRFSFDEETGDLFIADVGLDNFEEINFVAAGSPGGLNFGWNYFEGLSFYGENTAKTVPDLPNLVLPVFVYYHHPSQCAVVGGYVYRGSDIPSLQGKYIYGDYCTGFIWALSRTGGQEWVSELIFDAPISLTSFGTDDQNELYLLGLQGEILKLVP